MHLALAMLLSVTGGVTAFMQVRTSMAPGKSQPYVYALLTMVMISLLAMVTPSPISVFYKGAVILGLLIATFGVVFLTIPDTPLYVGLAHFFVVFFLYFMAFSSQTSLQFPTPWVVLILASGAGIYFLLAPHMREEKGAVIAYIVMLGFVAWRALEMLVQTGEYWALFAFLGVLLLSIASAVLALDKFRQPILGARFIVPSTYYVGQWLIAWSIWGTDLFLLR